MNACAPNFTITVADNSTVIDGSKNYDLVIFSTSLDAKNPTALKVTVIVVVLVCVSLFLGIGIVIYRWRRNKVNDKKAVGAKKSISFADDTKKGAIGEDIPFEQAHMDSKFDTNMEELDLDFEKGRHDKKTKNVVPAKKLRILSPDELKDVLRGKSKDEKRKILAD